MHIISNLNIQLIEFLSLNVMINCYDCATGVVWTVYKWRVSECWPLLPRQPINSIQSVDAVLEIDSFILTTPFVAPFHGLRLDQASAGISLCLAIMNQ